MGIPGADARQSPEAASLVDPQDSVVTVTKYSDVESTLFFLVSSPRPCRNLPIRLTHIDSPPTKNAASRPVTPGDDTPEFPFRNLTNTLGAGIMDLER